MEKENKELKETKDNSKHKLSYGHIVMEQVDDKHLIILSVTVIAVAALFKLSDPVNILTNALSGLFGMAVGKRINR